MKFHVQLWYLSGFSLEVEIYQINVVEKSKPHIIRYKNIFRKSAVYEKKWKNLIETAMPQMTIRHVHIAC